jgi:hypothetical protein
MHSGLKFHITRHFAKRVAERGVLVEDAKCAVKYADEEKRLQPGHAVTQKWVLPKERPESAPVDSKVVLPKAP